MAVSFKNPTKHQEHVWLKCRGFNVELGGTYGNHTLLVFESQAIKEIMHSFLLSIATDVTLCSLSKLLIAH
jgi:hypothetical protein